ncbi:nucleotidyl transferase AbiEii/AbiGii toxin family protein [candidate division KSB1 bacterium]|nr:nucleotidyl transferase AbiEii/AbiGii toxin family protein [candidate division KSB1 bacterium]
MVQQLKNFYREATSEERERYEQSLYALQVKVFEVAKVYDDKLYLTGGTALSRFYFQHRLSDDLDFFTTTDDLKLIANDFVARLQANGLAPEIDKLDVYFARIFAEEKGLKLKIEFVREFNLYGKLIKTDKGIYVNNLEDIGANKISAFEDRAEMKDIIDLFFITKKLSWDELFRIADTKRVPVAYENLLTINVEGISGKVLTLTDIDEAALAAFVDELKAQTEAQIKKKEQAAMNNLTKIVEKLLWDFPHEDRKLDQHSKPVLKRRLSQLPLPERKALETSFAFNEIS